MIEVGAESQIPGRPSFVVAAMSRNRLVVKSNSVERTVDEVMQFRLEIWESSERQSVDPTRASLMAGKKQPFYDMPPKKHTCARRRARRHTPATTDNLNASRQ